MAFEVHPQLRKDCHDLGEVGLCRLLLMNDSRFPWFILVPQRSEITESYQLSDADQAQLQKESTYLSQNLAEIFSADKMNIAALGNIVPQLHIHHIVRYKTDPAWPSPVWGVGKAVEYEPDNLAQITTKLKRILDDYLK